MKSFSVIFDRKAFSFGFPVLSRKMKRKRQVTEAVRRGSLKKKTRWMLLIVAAALVMMVAGQKLFQHQQRQQEVDTAGTTTVKTNRSYEETQKIIEDYPQVAEALANTAKEPHKRMFPIPGLFQSVTFDVSNQKLETTDDMTPQGIALSEDYIFISQYSHDHQHHSVVQVLDRKSKAFIKTMPVEGIPHLGGLVYEPRNQDLWLATESPYSATLSKLGMKGVDDYDVYMDMAPVAYNGVTSVLNVPKASLIAYLEPFMVVGYFDKTGEGALAMYPIDKQGNISSLVEDKQATGDLGAMDKAHEAVTDDTANIMKKIQGIAYSGQYMFMSQSFGPNNSKLFIFDLQDTKGGFSEESAKKVIEFPPYLEQITIDGKEMYALFESGAKPYRHHTDKNMEYVLQLDVKTLLKDLTPAK